MDAIVHLAAQVSVENSWNNPVYDAENNIISTINLLIAGSEYGVEKFVYTSSAAVYGNPQYVPIDEEHPKNPISPYVIAKFISRAKQKLPPVIYGDGKQTRDFISDVIDFVEIALKRGENREVYNVGTGKETSILELAEIVTDCGH